MKTKLTILSLLAAASFVFADEHKDAGHVTAKHALTLEGAKQVGEAAMQVIGAIGVSGAKSAAQDEEVAKAGAAVLETKVAAK